MREFSSYGLINKKLHYYVPRKELFSKAYKYLVGNEPEEGGHYITVWAPRQSGKSSLLRDVYWELLKDDMFYTVNIDVQNLQSETNTVECMNTMIDTINCQANILLPKIQKIKEFQEVFSAEQLSKPLILIIDEFDSLHESSINDIVGIFRNIYNARQKERAPSSKKKYRLHGLALIGIRSVLGVENPTGSPFNVQRSLYVHNLSEEEVHELFHWYENESGQTIEQEVVDRIYYVTQGHPGLVNWFGELLTNTFNEEPRKPLTMEYFTKVYTMALQGLPNNTMIHIISKARAKPYRQRVLEYFSTDSKMEFRFENKETSYLYMHGVISYERSERGLYVRFPCQFIQEKLFDYFSEELVDHSPQLLVDPFVDLRPIINEKEIIIYKLLELYQKYYTENREYLRRYANRRSDMRVMEVVYHFQLYSWLDSSLKVFDVVVRPEFPTGNGKIDLLIFHPNKIYGLELRSFSHIYILDRNIKQASQYGKSLGLSEITLVIFLDRPLPDEWSEKYSRPQVFQESATVSIFFLITG